MAVVYLFLLFAMSVAWELVPLVVSCCLSLLSIGLHSGAAPWAAHGGTGGSAMQGKPRPQKAYITYQLLPTHFMPHVFLACWGIT